MLLGDIMKIYLDLVFLLNFFYDLLILMTVDITLKRNAKFIKLLLSAGLGGISLGLLFLPWSSILLFFLKILVSIGMVLIPFGFKNIKYTFSNLFYLYMVSITLGGFLYFLNVQFSYKQEGLVFYFEGLSVNYILLMIIAPVILCLYVHEHKKVKSTYNLNYEVKIIFKDKKELVCQGFVDSGNRLRDPCTKKYVILLASNLLRDFVHNKDPIYVPYTCINKSGVIKCFSIESITINQKRFTNYLVGEAMGSFRLNGSDCLLNYKLMEDI